MKMPEAPPPPAPGAGVRSQLSPNKGLPEQTRAQQTPCCLLRKNVIKSVFAGLLGAISKGSIGRCWKLPSQTQDNELSTRQLADLCL
ncbi:hypothetical protein J6590_010255 [Homalodisca vitripennis]|nr:hypothetical protein J6590_010255 [Homalodisca vitripennis]